MPATSIAQQTIMAIALKCKRTGDCPPSAKIRNLAKNMSTSSLRDFARTSHSDLPYKKESFAGFNRFLKLSEANNSK
jgi:hypothetical protein